jgi:capsular polysaccharide biosynthesis protein
MEIIQQQIAQTEVFPPKASIAVLRNVMVFGRGVIMGSDMRLVRESLINTWGQLSFGPFRREAPGGPISMVPIGPTVSYSGDCVPVLIKQEYDRNYGHWIIESLPRVDMVQEGITEPNLLFVVGSDTGPIGAVYKDSLERAGVARNRVVGMADEAIHFDRLIYPTPITSQPWIKAPRSIRVLERIAATHRSTTSGPQRLYVNRNSATQRKLINESAIKQTLSEFGFATIDPGSCSFQEQIDLFKDATYVVGILGAGLSNIAFSPPGVCLLALTTEYMQDDFFWDLIAHKRGKYFSLHGKAVNPTQGMQSDFAVDEIEFKQLLEEFLCQSTSD